MFNDTKVFRLVFTAIRKTGAKIEVFLLRELKRRESVVGRLLQSRLVRSVSEINSHFGDDDSMVAEAMDNTTSRGEGARYDSFTTVPTMSLRRLFTSWEKCCCPSYIARPVEEMDVLDLVSEYFASNEGAVVTPAAGLHFSRELLKRMEIKGIDYGFLTFIPLG